MGNEVRKILGGTKQRKKERKNGKKIIPPLECELTAKGEFVLPQDSFTPIFKPEQRIKNNDAIFLFTYQERTTDSIEYDKEDRR